MLYYPYLLLGPSNMGYREKEERARGKAGQLPATVRYGWTRRGKQRQ